MQKIALINVKGGVGKTTLTQALARMLQTEGFKVGITDADVQKPDLSKIFDMGERLKDVQITSDKIKPIDHEGMKIFSLGFYPDAERAMMLEDKQTAELVWEMFHTIDWGDIDYLIVDCPPQSNEISQQLVRQFKENGDGFIIVTQPKDMPLLDTKRTIDFLNENDCNIFGIILNQAWLRTNGTVKFLDMDESAVRAMFPKIPIISEIPLIIDDSEPTMFLDTEQILKAIKPKFRIGGGW